MNQLPMFPTTTAPEEEAPAPTVPTPRKARKATSPVDTSPAGTLTTLAVREAELEAERQQIAAQRLVAIAAYMAEGTHTSADLARLLGVTRTRASQLTKAAGVRA